MLTKKQVQTSIEKLPENFTAEQAIEEIILLDKIQQGLKDIEEGRVYSTEEVKERMSKWLK